jgi:divalent metal cation (Fe/Co/Zn/Cd) transporter
LKEIPASDAAVERVGRVLTMHMGPNQILVNAELRFNDEIAGREIADAVIRLEERMRRAHAEITNVFIEPTHA